MNHKENINRERTKIIILSRHEGTIKHVKDVLSPRRYEISNITENVKPDDERLDGIFAVVGNFPISHVEAWTKNALLLGKGNFPVLVVFSNFPPGGVEISKEDLKHKYGIDFTSIFTFQPLFLKEIFGPQSDAQKNYEKNEEKLNKLLSDLNGVPSQTAIAAKNNLAGYQLPIEEVKTPETRIWEINCPAKDCTEKLSLRVTTENTMKAKENPSGMLTRTILCRGKSRLGPHAVDLKTDEYGNIRMRFARPAKVEDLKPQEIVWIIAWNMIYPETEEPQQQREKNEDVMKSLHELLSERIPTLKQFVMNYSSIEREERKRVLTTVYSHICSLWKKLPINTEIDFRLTEKQVVTFFFHYWMRRNELLSDLLGERLFNEIIK